MFVKSKIMIIKAITPIHAGIGRALGLIDMPIQKEKHTGIPKIEGSSLKGSMRELHYINNKNNDETNKLFGPESGNESAGLLGFTDAKLLFYPVISLNTLFSYITCPYLLNRYFEDINLSNKKSIKKVPAILEGQCVVLSEKNNENNPSSIILDQYSFAIKNIKEYETVKKDISNIDLKEEKDIVVISDEDFIEMISLCRDVITRNKIDHETGTVIDGGLFTEEYLPAESILYFLILKNGIDTDDKELYDNYINSFPEIMQIGGNATIGKGISRIQIID